MADNPDDANASDDKKTSPEAAASHDGNGIDKNLPMVIAPKLGAGEDEPVDETSGEAADAAAPAAQTSSTRFLMLAATVAFAAAFGSFVGSVSGSGLARFIYPAAPMPASATETTAQTLQQTKIELAELAAIRTGLDNAVRNNASQFAKISDRLDRIDQRSTAAADTTGSLAATPAAAEAPKTTDRILQDWIVQDVRNGRALVESRFGGIFDVGAGSILPGVGRVDTIKRQDGQWLVLTARGTITSGH